jgi:lipopolysaccharide export LptBFGC system permease protein LptF
MAQQSFQFNGKTYQSLDELPEEFKLFFKDENNNGIPDIFENIQNYAQQGDKNANLNFTQYHISGKTYNSLAEVPLEQQQLIKDKLSQLNFAEPSPQNTVFNNSPTPANDSFNLNQNYQSPHKTPNYNGLALGFLVLAIVLIALAFYFG